MMRATRERLTDSRYMLALVVAGGVVMGLGCGTKPALTRTNAPPQGQATEVSPTQEYYVHMTDNALLSDRSMSAVHFVSDTAELNTLGVRRLLRYAAILKVYGGKLRYDGTESDRELRGQRIEQMRSFLLASGLESGQFEVEQGFAGGEEMLAAEAMLIRAATRGPGDVKIQAPTGGSGGGSGGSK